MRDVNMQCAWVLENMHVRGIYAVCQGVGEHPCETYICNVPGCWRTCMPDVCTLLENMIARRVQCALPSLCTGVGFRKKKYFILKVQYYMC